MTSRTTWKNRGIRAAVALAAVAAIAVWLLVYWAASALAEEYLPTPWDGIVQWGLLFAAVFLCFYLPSGSGRRRPREVQVRVNRRPPNSTDRARKDELWYELDPHGAVRNVFVQTGSLRKSKWEVHLHGGQKATESRFETTTGHSGGVRGVES